MNYIYIYIIDLCFEENAEQKCQNAIQNALNINKYDNIEINIVYASFLLSTSKLMVYIQYIYTINILYLQYIYII